MCARRLSFVAKYRYLDIRRAPIRDALLLRNRVCKLVREALGSRSFCEVETPVLIKSTPEGARDFVVPSRMNPGQVRVRASERTFSAGVSSALVGARVGRDSWSERSLASDSVTSISTSLSS